jgi:hypothetical protein
VPTVGSTGRYSTGALGAWRASRTSSTAMNVAHTPVRCVRHIFGSRAPASNRCGRPLQTQYGCPLARRCIKFDHPPIWGRKGRTLARSFVPHSAPALRTTDPRQIGPECLHLHTPNRLNLHPPGGTVTLKGCHISVGGTEPCGPITPHRLPKLAPIRSGMKPRRLSLRCSQKLSRHRFPSESPTLRLR